MTNEITVPIDWEILGELPAALSSDDLLEDIVQVRARSGEFIIDVGWLPALDLNGRFRCQIIERREWESAVEELTTRDLETVRGWLADAIERYAARLTTPDEMGDVVNVEVAPIAPAVRSDEPTIDLRPVQTIQAIEERHRDAA